MYLGAHKHMFYGDIYLEGEWLGHKLYTSCSLLDDVNLLSIVIVPIYTPSSGVSEILVFNSLAMLGVGPLASARQCDFSVRSPANYRG